MLKLDIGGGRTPRDGFINIDIVHGEGIYKFDLDKVSPAHNERLPFDDDSVDEVYSSHCFEHLKSFSGLLQELGRVCVVGAPVEIRVPHWADSMAFITGHVGAISEHQVKHWREFADDWWGQSKKWLSEPRIEYVRSARFDEAWKLFPHLREDQVMRFIQDTCHEIRYKFTMEMR